MSFRHNFETIGKLLDIVRDAGGNVPADFYPDKDAPQYDGNYFKAAKSRRTALGNAILWAFTWADGHPDLSVHPERY